MKAVRRHSRWLVAGACALGLIGGVAWADRQAEAGRAAALQAEGRQLYRGEASALGALPGRLVGHITDLPVAATRCVNCHAAKQGRAAGPGTAADFAPRLQAALLTQAQPRRGGPPSAYDVASLCKLLREGIDPAWIVIDQTMPRYPTASDAQCAALWAFLTDPASAGTD